MDTAKPRNFEIEVEIKVITNPESGASYGTPRPVISKGRTTKQGEMGWDEVPALITAATDEARNEALRRIEGSEARFAERENEGLDQ